MTNVRPRSLPLAALLALAGGALVGCGGSGGGSSPTPTATGASVVAGFDVSWAARSREVSGPASALSLVVTFAGAGADGKDVVTVVDRKADPAAYVQTYATAKSVLTGVRTARFEFHAAPGGAGSIVAATDLGGLVRSDGSFTRADGAPFGAVRTIGRVASVKVTGPATADLNVPTTYGAAAFDADGNPLALSPGSFRFAASSAKITPDGSFTPALIGAATITASADGVDSTPFAVNVGFGASSGLRLVNAATNALAFTRDGSRLFATTGATGPNPNSLVEIAPATGTVRVVAALGGVGSALDVSPNGGTAYVGVGNNVFQVDTGSGNVSTPISLGATNRSDLYIAGSIAISPTDPNAFVVGRVFSGSGGYGGAALYRNGVLQAQTTTGFNYDGGIVRFSEDGTSLYDFDNQTTGFGLVRYAVGPNSLTETARRSGVVQVFNTGYLVLGGRVYFSSGQVLDGTSLAEVGRFAVDSSASGVTANADGTRIFFGPNQSGAPALTAFDAVTRAQTASIPLPVSVARASVGAGGRIAVPLSGNGGLLLIDAPTATGNRSRPRP